MVGLVVAGLLHERDNRTNLKVMTAFEGPGEGFIVMKHFSMTEGNRRSGSRIVYTLEARAIDDGRKLGAVDTGVNAQIFGGKDGQLWVNILPRPSLANITKSR